MGVFKKGKKVDDAVDAAVDAASDVSVAGRPWRAHRVGDTGCLEGCADVARDIHGAIGGDIHVIRPSGGAPMLGPMRDPGGEFVNPAGDLARGWAEHHVVVRDGKVYDAFTGPAGEAVDEYKSRFQYADAIDFGF